MGWQVYKDLKMVKAPRQEQVAAIKKENPDRQPIDIARELGITRQRVSQILKRLGYPPGRIRKPKLYCISCGKKLSPYTKGNLCRTCYIADLKEKIWVELTCPVCGRLFARTRSYVRAACRRRQRLFCSHSCQAKGGKRK